MTTPDPRTGATAEDVRGATVAVVGAGHWHAPRHIESLVAAGATITGVTADEQPAARRWSDELGCPAYPDVRALLDAVDTDLVIAMPRHSDASAVLSELTARRIPFVIEKPAALSAAELLPHVQEVERTGQFAAVPLINRYSHFWTRLDALRADRLLDPVCTARFRIVNGPPSRYVDDGVGWVLDPAVSGGGALRNLGTHTVDAYLSIATAPVEVLGAAVTRRQHRLAVEEHAIAVLRDRAGLIGVVEAGYSRPDVEGTDQEWCVAGPGAYLTELHDTLEVVTAATTEQHPSPTVMERYRLFADDVLRRLARGEPTPVSLRECWQVIEVIDRIYAHAS